MAYSRPPGGKKAFATTPHNEVGYQFERNRIKTENAQKTERLKALRLAKEAADRLEAEKNPVTAKKRRAKKAVALDAPPA